MADCNRVKAPYAVEIVVEHDAICLDPAMRSEGMRPHAEDDIDRLAEALQERSGDKACRQASPR